MNSWCESCARKNYCYTSNTRPKCYVPLTNTVIVCPRCGDTKHVKSLEKDFDVKDSVYKYKCINCNIYFNTYL